MVNKAHRPVTARPSLRAGFLLLSILSSLDAAEAASQQFCEAYADGAVQQREMAINWNVPDLEGPAWSPDRYAHYLWCLTVPEETANQETAKRQQRLDASVRLPMQQGSYQAWDLLRAPGLVIGLRHTYCKAKKTVYGGDPPIGNHQAGRRELADPAIVDHPLLTYHCGGDAGAPEGVGFAWSSFRETAGPPVETIGLPAGVVAYLYHDQHQEQPAKYRECYANSCNTLEYFGGGDHGAEARRGFVWYETSGLGFDGDWSIVDRLPKYTVIGLTHSENLGGKRLYWLGRDGKSVVTYDARGGPEPPNFRRVHGGDIGAPEGSGYFWFEKTTGPEPKDIR